MDRFLRPSGAVYFVVAVVFIGLLAGLPTWAAKNSAKAAQVAAKAAQDAAAPAHDAHKPMTTAEHAAGGHEPTAHKEILERGRHMYVQYCLSCHGDAGKGDGPGGANLAIKPQDLTVGAVMNPLPDEFLHRVIADGPQSVGLSALMPPFKPQLGDRQINEIIVYVRTLATPAYDPAKVLPVTATREGPVQPIFFSHVIHTGSYQIACQYCHAGARRSSDAGLPSVEKCMGCHKIVAAQGNAQVQKLHGYWNDQQPIPWVRIFKIPEYAQFPHKNHIQAGLVCQTCHGRIEAMEQVNAKTGQNPVNDVMNLAAMPVPGPKLTMGWCVECHRAVNENGVLAVQPTPDAWGAAPRPATADDTKKRNAPLECVACHH
jgi:mono/diheme cytochrome c family protein